MRGDVCRLRSPRGTIGHEQRGERFAVVVQSDGFALSTLVVAPTSTSAGRAVFRPEIELDGKSTRVLVDQISAVDTSRLGDFAGRLDPHEMHEINVALRGFLGLFRW
ncbi:type II toxin-antitoxin system PemK/MazF family toxin [Microbispora sp. ATCC PTA-5024]|uniref:type II toxin-antitoxin system PemK/MazF family toxin n=1 Tax=Microbispora sp. ATCC PTA-5024 TaxID=316330 RepID=UPI0003DB9706|nr:type II toxin-antitoxin system PemK/MazF family toxin [Microbispora sp. ATCC PTA-5024]ETK33920.1 growth inhibitor PemK [Microbispora sp. ATCC PTA-5024]